MGKRSTDAPSASSREILRFQHHSAHYLSHQDTVVIFQLYEQYPDYRAIYSDAIVNANIMLVVKYSEAPRFQGKGLTKSDLIQEGMIGLMRAVRSYDWRRGFKFSTYASHWIKQAMQRACRFGGFNGRAFYIPQQADVVTQIVNYEADKLRELLRREPTDDEIAATLTGSTSNRKKCMADSETVRAIRSRGSARSISLDAPTEHSDRSLQETLALHEACQTEDIDISRDEAKTLAEQIITACLQCLASATDYRRDIFVRRFGIDRTRESLAEIASTLDRTSEAIRQSELWCLRCIHKQHGYDRETIDAAAEVLYPNR